MDLESDYASETIDSELTGSLNDQDTSFQVAAPANLQCSTPPSNPLFESSAIPSQPSLQTRAPRQRAKGPRAKSRSAQRSEGYAKVRREEQQFRKNAEKKGHNIPRPSIFKKMDVHATPLDPSSLRGTSTGFKGVPSKFDRFKRTQGQSEFELLPDIEEVIPPGCDKRVHELVRQGYHYISNKKWSGL